MSQHWTVPAWAAVALAAVVLVLLVVLVALLLQGRATRRELSRARQDAQGWEERLTALEERLVTTAPPRERPRQPQPAQEEEFLITHLGGPGTGTVDVTDPAPVVPAPVFADLVLRESAVQAVTLAAGLRRALSPETRHRIRFEMRREVKRARKQRRADLRAARRDLHARQRAAA